MTTNFPQRATRRVAVGTGLVFAGFLGITTHFSGLSTAAYAQTPTAGLATAGAQTVAQPVSGSQVSVPMEPATVTNVRCHIMPIQGGAAPVTRPPCDTPPESAPGGNPPASQLGYGGGSTISSTNQRFIYINCAIDNNHCDSNQGFPWDSSSHLFASTWFHVMDQYVGSRANGRYTSNATYAWIATSINHTLFDSDVQNWIVYAIRNVLNPSGGGAATMCRMPSSFPRARISASTAAAPAIATAPTTIAAPAIPSASAPITNRSIRPTRMALPST